ncbi:MAG: glycosyltransferase [Luteitalea sp.]|nr:glycosyltransferase [Luteitalea sp.]
MKLAVVVQRYGAEINGGAELHARYIAERLARRHDVDVLTTCARDYVTWADAYPAGEDRVNGLRVRRFPVARERRPDDFGRLSLRVFQNQHSLADELAWLTTEGPTSPALVAHLASEREAYDYFIFFSYRYYHAYHGVRTVPQRAILVPTAERDAAIGLALFPPIFRAVRAIMYNSPEERAMIGAIANNQAVPGVVVGVSSHIPERAHPERFRQKYGISGPFVLYVGRIDENKGCAELFRFFLRQVAARSGALRLVLVGNSILPIPEHSSIRHLGFVSDEDKFDAIAACEVLVMPSFFESLSMVTLEAWALGRPVLANGRCDVLVGQCLRSNAGLFYENGAEFTEALRVLWTNRVLNRTMGQSGREYFQRHYRWPVIDRKYEETLADLAAADRRGPCACTIEPLPGWFRRRRREIVPANTVLAAIPARQLGHAHDAAMSSRNRQSRRDSDRLRARPRRARRLDQ